MPGNQELRFRTPAEMLDFVTRNWLSDFVTVDLNSNEVLRTFLVRPFFLVVHVDAPILCRYYRSMR